MENSNQRLKIVQNAIHVIGLTMAVVLYIDMLGRLKIPWYAILLCASLVYLFFWLIEYNHKNIVTYAALAVLTVLGSLFLVSRQIDPIKEMIKWRNWFLIYQEKEEEYWTAYAFAIVVLILIAVMLICYLLNQNRIMWYAVIGVSVGVLIYSLIREVSVNKASVAIVIIFALQIAVELCNISYNKKSNGINWQVSLYMLPLCLVIGITAVLLPSSEKPIQWTVVRQVASAFADKADDIHFYFSQLGGDFSGEYGVSFVGFSDRDSDELGGNIHNMDRILLKIKPDSRAYERTYLVGKISDQYVSNGWKRSDINLLNEQEANIDFYEMLLGLYQQQVMSKENELLLHTVKLSIRYQNIRTKSIFYSPKLYNLNVGKKNISYDKSNPAILASRFLKKGFQYQINYDEVNYESEAIQNNLRNISKVNQDGVGGALARPYQEEDCRSYVKQISDLTYLDNQILNERFSDLLNKRADVIEQYYTQIPGQIPERVYHLTQEITGACDNNYDKLKAIEEYLSAMSYTKTPAKTPEGEDFVDYFLFHQKEGYCTYFATAMAVMGRCIGIPTRYVEGMVVDYKKKSNGEYLVNSNAAHAWVEAYIKGFGWVPFEPTPNMRQYNDSNWEMTKSPTAGIQPVAPSMPVYDNAVVDNQLIQIAKQKSRQTFYIVRICLLIIILIGILLVGIVSLLEYNRRKKYHTSPPREKILYLIPDMIACLKLEGYQLKESETLQDFSIQISEKYKNEAGSFGEMISIYQKLRYGDKNPKESDLEKVERFHNQLKRDLRKKWGWLPMVKYQLGLLIRGI